MKKIAILMLSLLPFQQISFAKNFTLVTPGAFTIAHDDSFAPFGYAEKDATGKYGPSQGFEIDLLKKVVSKMGLKTIFKPDAWAKVLVSVKVGDADAIATIGINEERKKSYDYTNPYASYASSLFVVKNSTIKGLNDLKGKKIGIQKNHFSVPWIREHYPEVEQITFENANDAFLAVLSGKVNGAVADKLVGLFTMKENNELKGKLKSVGKEFAMTPVALAFAKGKDRKLIKAFNLSLKKLQNTTELSSIYKKWFGIEK